PVPHKWGGSGLQRVVDHYKKSEIFYSLFFHSEIRNPKSEILFLQSPISIEEEGLIYEDIYDW
ncbi:MAG: hypothetical protein ACPGWR_30470, partial [Ardenticatenaceae bacterium]